MAEVSLEGVSKRYGAVVALEPLDLVVQEGAFVSLLGPSGSGKSTTLNLLTGLQDPDAGRIVIGGRDVTNLPPEQRDLALVFQNYALYPHLTVFENIAFPLEARRPSPPRAEIARRVEETAEVLGIGELLARYPREISGGQQQRVALGRAMVREPKVFLLDEPLSNLDARLRLRMRRDLRALHARLGSTVVYVTHDQSEAMTLSSRIAVFNRGRLQQFASPDEIYNRPANLFVANFIGDRESNVLEAELVEDAGGLRLRAAGLDLPLSRPRPPARTRSLKIGIRPEAVRPYELAAEPPPGSLPAEVIDTELAGPDRYVFARLDGGAEVACRADPSMRVGPGARIWVHFDEDRLHLFDPDSGDGISHGGAAPRARPTGGS
jgi:ABC-type sugar transport system ATPase subunit